MTPCNEIRELLSARIDGELSTCDARRLDEHLAGCEDCRRELAEMERVWLGLGALGEPLVPEGLAERMIRRTAGAERRGRRARLVWSWGAAGAVAAAVLIAVVVLNWEPGVKPPDAETQQIVKDIDLLQNLDVLEHLDTVEQLGDGVLLLSDDQSATEGES